MNWRSLISHPASRLVLASLLTGVVAWAGASETTQAHVTKRERSRCDSTVTALQHQLHLATTRADSLANVIRRRDEAYARHVKQQGSGGAVTVVRESGKSPWLVAAGSFVLGGVVGYLIGDHDHATAVASATASTVGKACVPKGKKPKHGKRR